MTSERLDFERLMYNFVLGRQSARSGHVFRVYRAMGRNVDVCVGLGGGRESEQRL